MRPQETQKLLCNTCGKKFEITLEPEQKLPEICPYCDGTLEKLED